MLLSNDMTPVGGEHDLAGALDVEEPRLGLVVRIISRSATTLAT